MNEKQTRSPAMDLIRCIALLSVISVHFLWNNGFYEYPVVGIRMSVMTMLRSACMICVPLYMMLSGYLLKNKELNKAYFTRVLKILFVYVATSLICIGFKVLVLHKRITIPGMVMQILSFQASEYAWYVEMYLGLFLLIPFLNILYKALETKKKRQFLLAVMITLTLLPRLLNIFKFDDLGWWLHPSSNHDYNQLIPEWWMRLFPITYYFLGSYLRDYPVKLKWLPHLALTVAATVLFGLFNVYRSYGTVFVQGGWSDWNSFIVAVQTVLVFSFLQNRSYKKMGAGVAKALAKISEWSLGAYLVSSAFDDLAYPILNSRIDDMPLRLNWFVPVVLFVLVGSLAVSACVSGVWKLTGEKWLKKREKVC